MSSFVFWSVNYIAVEIERPYGQDANDLPLTELASAMNSALCNLLQPGAQKPPRYYLDVTHSSELQEWCCVASEQPSAYVRPFEVEPPSSRVGPLLSGEAPTADAPAATERKAAVRVDIKDNQSDSYGRHSDTRYCNSRSSLPACTKSMSSSDPDMATVRGEFAGCSSRLRSGSVKAGAMAMQDPQVQRRRLADLKPYDLGTIISHNRSDSSKGEQGGSSKGVAVRLEDMMQIHEARGAVKGRRHGVESPELVQRPLDPQSKAPDVQCGPSGSAGWRRKATPYADAAASTTKAYRANVSSSYSCVVDLSAIVVETTGPSDLSASYSD
eukprot:TRINITY_DN21467_c0_g1_i4.p1 TRINITY_DN21467_c0_g1~~TRINITY_DN21467_c0_g1_i4.p1  ORF type:complete len:327 (+),score=31.88 TRINITY_DN21467_c0_g1_i4:682-1662(+)